MRHYDDDDLERALFALDLEEPPAGLRQTILARTIYHVPVVAAVRPWEPWLYGGLCAVLVWMLWLVMHGGAAQTVEQAVSYSDVAVGFLSHPANLFWIAVGGAATVWFSQLNLTGAPGYQPAARR